MPLFASNIGTFIEHCRKLVNNDWDNVILFTGREGSGKTTWAMQIGRALDPEGFPGPLPDLSRILFNHNEFLQTAANAPKKAAILWDEGRLNKRRAMHGSTLEVLDYLQDCRALNHHLLICFPHEGLLDAAVKDHRIRWRMHVVRRGLAELHRRVEGKGRYSGKFFWKPTGDRFSYGPNKGPIATAYKKKKEDHMRRKADPELAERLALDEKGREAFRQQGIVLQPPEQAE